MGNAGLTTAGRRAWESHNYSDLIIKCKSHEFKAHKVIVCMQSDFFANAVKEGSFKEGKTGIVNMDEDDPDVIARMLEFLYTSTYSVAETKDIHPLLFHVEMYAIADRIQNEKLRSFAQERFEETARVAWNHPDFASAIRAVYNVAPPGTTGEHLRGIASGVAAKHAKLLFEKDDAFNTVTESIAEFGRDLAKALAVSSHQEWDSFRCLKPSCRFSFKLPAHTSRLDAPERLSCPACRKKIGRLEVTI